MQPRGGGSLLFVRGISLLKSCTPSPDILKKFFGKLGNLHEIPKIFEFLSNIRLAAIFIKS